MSGRTARTYGGVHRALIRERGSPVGRPCAAPGCEEPSTGWGLTTHPTTIGVNGHGHLVRFSTNLDAYEPLCRSHNAQRDHGGNWLRCPQGHDRATWGADAAGTCRGCKREHDRRRYALKTSTPTGADHAQQGIHLEQNGG